MINHLSLRMKILTNCLHPQIFFFGYPAKWAGTQERARTHEKTSMNQLRWERSPHRWRPVIH